MKTEAEWKFIRDNLIWEFEQEQSHILPALRLSYDEMSQGECSVVNSDSRWISDNIRYLRIFLSENNLTIKLQGIATNDVAAIGESSTDQIKWWHKQLGHMSVKGRLALGKQGLLDRNKLSNCILGKSHWLKFSIAIQKTKGTLDYIYSNLWGSSMVPHSFSKCRYFVSFISYRLLMILLENL